MDYLPDPSNDKSVGSNLIIELFLSFSKSSKEVPPYPEGWKNGFGVRAEAENDSKYTLREENPSNLMGLCPGIVTLSI